MVFTFVEVMKGVDISKYLNNHSSNANLKLPAYCTLMTILFAYADMGHPSLRDIEKRCKVDVRYLWLSQETTPSHQFFARFMNENLISSIDNIFTDINKQLIELDDLDMTKLYVDGSKWEAYARKTSFVWKKAVLKYQEALFKKITSLINRMNETMNTSTITKAAYKASELVAIIEYLNNYIVTCNIQMVYGRGHRKSQSQKLLEKFTEFEEKLVEYEIHLKIMGDRNSYSKTDHDATFMNMKYDYYNKTGVFKPGYNIQAGTCDGYVVQIGIFSARADTVTLTEFIDSFNASYGFYPEYVVADAGYGSTDNYIDMIDRGIGIAMKYSNFKNVNQNPSYLKKHPYSYLNFKSNEKGKIICPKGNEMDVLIDATIDKKGKYWKPRVHYTSSKCESCPYSKECTKAKDGKRKYTYSPVDQELQKEADRILLSEEGKEMRKQRSIQTEGFFGVLKEDQQFTRLWRRGKENVNLEVKLCATGFNIRKYYYKKLKERQMSN